ncbi:MAG: hypothetical protein RR403_05395, partial [Pseudoflavonifractor sp.]
MKLPLLNCSIKANLKKPPRHPKWRGGFQQAGYLPLWRFCYSKKNSCPLEPVLSQTMMAVPL